MNSLLKNKMVKELMHHLMINPVSKRVRWWFRLVIYPFFIKKGKGAIISRKARVDVIPTKIIKLGEKAVIEDYAIVNNGMGDVIIGNNSKVTSRVKIVGPVELGDMVTIGSGAQLTGLVHNFEDISVPIRNQGVRSNKVTVEDDVWIGGNSVIIQGIRIGTHSIIASGSVVTKDVPPYSVVAGNPARVIKQYNPETSVWESVKKKSKVQAVS